MARFQDDLRWVRAAPGRGMRICSGACALAYEAVAGTVRDPGEALERVELRGVRLQRSLLGSWRALGRDSGAELNRLADNVAAPVRWVQRGVRVTGASSADEVERHVEGVLERLGLPSRERLDRLAREIESLSARIDQDLAALDRYEPRA